MQSILTWKSVINYNATIMTPSTINVSPNQYDKFTRSPNKYMARMGTITIARAEKGYAKLKGILCKRYNQNTVATA